MSQISRTNQLIYQAELLLEFSSNNSEGAPAAANAMLEGAASQLALALNSLIAEVAAHAEANPGSQSDYMLQSWLEGELGELPELARIRHLARDPNSFVHRIKKFLWELHDVKGLTDNYVSQPADIIVQSNQSSKSEILRWCIVELKNLAHDLRETNQEW